MPVALHDLHQLGFASSHKITLEAGGMLRFAAIQGTEVSDKPAVYLWLANVAGSELGDVLYVGKAGKGVARRCVQHQGGFVNNGTGRRNAAVLADMLNNPSTSVTVMARKSGTATLFGKTVSLYATEEDALHALFAPRLNRAAFPEVLEAVAPDGPQSEAPRQDVAGYLARIAEVINALLRQQDQGAREDMLAQLLEAYSATALSQLVEMLEFVRDHVLAEGHSLKLVGKYIRDQVEGCNGVTTLGFGTLRKRNFAPEGWVARIYLTDTPRIAFPMRFLNPAARNNVDVATASFSPRDIEGLIREPLNYILPEHLA